MATVTITVNPTPTVGVSAGVAICSGSSTVLTGTGSVLYSWSPSASLSSSAGTSVIATPTATTTYTVTGAVGSCTNSATATITVNSTPVVSAGANVAICKGSPTTLTATGATTYTWSPSAGLSATAGTSVTANPTTTTVYTVTGTTGLCSSTAVVTVTVNPLANMGVTSGPTTVCTGSNITLVNDGQNGGTWSSTNSTAATVSATGIVTGLASGLTTISYTVTNGCGGRAATIDISVGPLPDAPGAISGPSAVCVGNDISLVSSGVGVWSSSIPTRASVSSTGTVTGLGSAAVIISFTSSNSCGSSSATYPVTVNPDPASISGLLSVCPGAITTLTTNPGGGVWSTFDGAVSVNPGNGKVTGVSAGAATITYTLPAGCRVMTTVTVTPPPGAIGGVLTVCPGSTTMVTNGTTGGTWASSSTARATVDENTGLVSAISSGITYITYTTSAGCYTTTVLTLNASPEAITGALTTCPGNSIPLSSLTSGGVWSSLNTAIATVNAASGLVKSVAGVGTATIVYTVGSLCPRTAVVTVAVPTANVGDPVVCLGQPISVAVVTNPTPGGTWTSSDLDKVIISSSTGVLKGLALGTAIVTYQLDPGCFSTSVVTVNPAIAPVVGSSGICPGSTVTLTNTSTGGTWSSSNPASATISSVGGVVSGISEGSTIISYIVNAGCYKSINLPVYGTISDITGIDDVCQGSTTTFSSGPSGGSWSSSVTTKATVNGTTGVVTGVAIGTSVISYKLGSSGCYVTKIVSVNAPVANITGAANVCPGFTVPLADATGTGTWSSSAPDKASVDMATGIVTGVSTGTAMISYLTGPTCYKTIIQTVNAVPAPIGGSSTVCEGANVTLTSSPGGTWSSSNPAAASISAGGVLTGIDDGLTTVTYRVSATNCAVTTDITVNSIPGLIGGTPSVCLGSITPLTSSPAGGAWSSSNTMKATIDAMAGGAAAMQVGTSNITYTLATGCYRKLTLTINAVPVAISGKDTVCAGSTIPLSNSTASGTWSSSNIAFATVNTTSGLVGGIDAGIVTISYKLSTGCAAIRQVTVNGLPPAITGPLTICTGTPQTLSSSHGGTWSSSLPAKATVDALSGVVSGIAAGTSSISYTLTAGGCYRKATVTVNLAPGTISGAATVMDGASTTLTCTPGGGTWSSSEPSFASVVAASGVVTGIDPGVSTIVYKLGTGCTSSRGITVVAARSGQMEVENASLFTVAPNPSSGQLTVNSSVGGVFTLYTIDGKKVEEYLVALPVTTVVLPGNLANGIYMCRFNGSDGSLQVVRLVFER